MKTKADDTVSPIESSIYVETGGWGSVSGQIGLTKREYFAGLAMQGLLVNKHSVKKDIIAEDAVEYADALIEQLNKEL